MTLYCAHANSRSPIDLAPHASIRYNHSQSSSGSQFLHLSTSPTLFVRQTASTIISERISNARDTRGTRNLDERAGETPAASMNVVHSTHQFADAATAQIQGLRSDHCQLVIRQGPQHAKVAIGKEKDRKPVDPPPIIQLKISPQWDPGQNYLQSPYFFMSCSLIGQDEGIPQGTLGAALAGTLVSSLHRQKDTDNNDGAFFVFGDLSVKLEGTFRLQFNLYEMRRNECYHIKCIVSDPFPVHSTKTWPGMSESTFLTRSFSDQGVRLRLRKEPRTLLRKRGPAHDDYQPRHYRTSNRQSSQGTERQSVTSPESQDAVRQNEQGEFVESPPGISGYDQRPQMGRQFSGSSASFAGMPYDESSKRPRTGSDHGQTPTFSQQPLENQGYRTLYADPQQSAFSAFSPQGQHAGGYGAYTYSQSPQASNISARDQYFAQKLNTQTGTTSPYDQSQRSPQYQSFPLQPQAIHYAPSPRQQGQYGTMMAPSPPTSRLIDTTQASMESLGIRGPNSPPGAPPTLGMGPTTTWGKSPNLPYLPSSGRRDSYQSFQSPNPNTNLSAGSMSGMYARSPVTTTGPSGLDGY